MKKISKVTRAIGIASLTAAMCVATSLAFTACGNNNPSEDKDPVITKYDATLDANVAMGTVGTFSMSSVFSDAYITEDNGSYTLTLTFKVGEVTVMGINGNAFVDDSPANPTTTDGITDGTLGVYCNDGNTLVTEGVKVTYSTGNDYTINNNKENVYYVKSAAFPVDSLRESYSIAMFVNSSMRGAQFSKNRPATVELDLESGNVVEEISGLGVDTRGEVIEIVEPTEDKYTSYEATLDSVVTMGQGNEVNFTENLLDGVYVIKKDGKYEVTLIFKSGDVNMPYGNLMTGFLTSAESVDHSGNTVTPVFGYYDGETLVTEGVTLTYSSGDDYVTNKNGSSYYVQSMTFTVNELKEGYNLSVYVMAGNESSASSMQFPYTMGSGAVCNAELTLDLTKANTVASISNLLGVETLGIVPEAQPDGSDEPEDSAYTKYEAELSCYVNAMGGMEFGSVLDSVYVSETDGTYTVTIVFKQSEVEVMGNKYDTCITDVEGETGYYDGETLVTEGITLTYSTGEEYVEIKIGAYPNQVMKNVYYIKSISFETDSLESTYNLALFLGSSAMSAQFGGEGTYEAVLTINLESGKGANEISGLGVETRGEVEAE